MNDARKLYSSAFYDENRRNALAAAQVIVPLLIELVRPASVVDVGCGSGAWLRVFQDSGVGLIRGLDGAYAQTPNLLIDNDCFEAVDLCGDFRIPSRFDLAVCLEVAEHVPKRCAARLISELVAAAPVVLFSAAIPGQGGTGHVSERWPGYWRALFASHGLRMLDLIRPRIRDDQRVKWWYRQNIVLFATDEAVRDNPRLAAEAGRPAPDIDWLHVDLVKNPRFLLRTLRDVLLDTVKSAARRRRACAR